MTLLVAAALIAIGQTAPAVVLPDDEGQPHTLPRHGQPLLVVYEDQDAGTQNKVTKATIAAYHDPVGNRGKVDVWPVADLSKWDFWPARSSARKHVQKVAADARSRILIDWKAACRTAWGMGRGQSSVLIVGADGRVLFATEGEQTVEQRAELERQMRALGLAPR